MPNLLISAIAVMIVSIMSGCKKNHSVADTDLTGTWIKGAYAGDTLYFTKSDDKNILRYNASFNPALPAVTQSEYSYLNGKLALKNFMTTGNDYHVIESFRWIEAGVQFEILGHEIFPFMSSMGTIFTYKKIP